MRALNVPPPGLGAWTVDIVYDPEFVEIPSCTANFGGICNASYGPTTVRVTAATAQTGVTGDRDLATITVTCLAEGQSALMLTVRVLADSSSGDPQPIASTTQDGTVSCGVVLGDAACDGDVDVIDAALILQFDAGLIDSLPCPENADVNGDGVINVIDAALILQLVAGLIDQF
jgi:hypothetical protein